MHLIAAAAIVNGRVISCLWDTLLGSQSMHGVRHGYIASEMHLSKAANTDEVILTAKYIFTDTSTVTVGSIFF
jgi:hypothetical protein